MAQKVCQQGAFERRWLRSAEHMCFCRCQWLRRCVSRVLLSAGGSEVLNTCVFAGVSDSEVLRLEREHRLWLCRQSTTCNFQPRPLNQSRNITIIIYRYTYVSYMCIYIYICIKFKCDISCCLVRVQWLGPVSEGGVARKLRNTASG